MEALLEKEAPNAVSEEQENPVFKAGKLKFYIRDNAVWASGEEEGEDFLVVSARFDIVEKLIHPESGAAWLRVKVESDPPNQFLCPAAKGALGIARRLQEIGEFVRLKPALLYIEELLARKWLSLATREMSHAEALEADHETGFLYELFIEFVKDFETKFDSGEWGTISKEDKEVAVTRPVMAEFFRRARVPLETQASVLRKWREKGWLKTDEDKKRFTKVVRLANNVRRRCYVLALRPNDEAIVADDSVENPTARSSE